MQKSILLFLLIVQTLFVFSNAPDTLYAIVEQSGQEETDFINKRWLTPEKINFYVDSLQKINLIKEAQLLNWYSDAQNHSFEKQSEIIDSLFACSPIPYSVINDYNFYLSKLAKIEELKPERKINSTAPFYENWDTQHPFQYAINLKTEDSLVLYLDSTKFTYPVPHKPPYKYHATVTSNYGWRNGRHHRGLDIDLHAGDSVVCAFDGVVRLAKYYGGYGRVVVVRHYNGLETLYAHLHRFSVSTGDTIKAGELVGKGGNSGHSQGSHLHFEIRKMGIPINPAHFINTKQKKLKAEEFTLKKHRENYVALINGQRYHKVIRGDHWHKISKRYGIELKKLYELNGISKPHTLSVGQMIRIGI